jgi:hypothetical protein
MPYIQEYIRFSATKPEATHMDEKNKTTLIPKVFLTIPTSFRKGLEAHDCSNGSSLVSGDIKFIKHLMVFRARTILLKDCIV